MMVDSVDKTNFDRPRFLAETKSLRDLLNDLRQAQVWLLIAAVAAFLASAFFVVKYFAGGEMAPEVWTSEQWLNAFLGLGITAVITAAQAFLYQSGYKGHAAALATLVVVFFGVFSEISQSMEREDATVRHRSENSAVFQAALGSINTVAHSATTLSNEQRGLADMQAHLAYWEGLKAQKNADHGSVKYSHRTLDRYIADYQRKVESFSQQIQLQGDNRSLVLNSAIEQAKALEYDEDKHYAMIRLMGDLFGLNGLWASFLFSLIIIGTFEYAFHFVGSYVADHKSALRLVGRDSQGEWIDPDKAAAEQARLISLTQGHLIPEDHGNKLRENYLDWVSPDRHERTDKPEPDSAEQSAPAKPTAAAARVEADNVHDLGQKRFFKELYNEVHEQLLKGKITPTIRPVVAVVSETIRARGKAMGLIPEQIGRPQQQRIAESILAQLERERVVQLNQDGGVGKPKYVLTTNHLNSLQSH